MECDTEFCVKPELRDKWIEEKLKWFSSEATHCKINFDGSGIFIPLAQYDKRTPGKFKPEFEGDGMICLNSKVYHIWSSRRDRDGNKGAQQKRNG